MVDNFDKILDECIDRINRGETVESCLASYPDFAEQLKPLLGAVLQTRETYTFAPQESTKMAAKRRFDAALEKRLQADDKKQPWLNRFFGRPLAWAAIATAAAAIFAVYFGLNQAAYPVGPTPDPDPVGNFVLLISDEVNAIEDFESLNVSITKVGLLSSGDSPEWVEFEPETEVIDLTTVKGDKTQQIWRGNIPEGEYTKVIIYVDDVNGVLKATGETVEVKLPSNKLQISKPFRITSGTVTSFTYDLTVISTGNQQSGIKYILKPQIGESGAESKPANNSTEATPINNKGKGRNK
jgi:hypothetical protein